MDGADQEKVRRVEFQRTGHQTFHRRANLPFLCTTSHILNSGCNRRVTNWTSVAIFKLSSKQYSFVITKPFL
jgi:hypothetical protein